MKKVLTIISLLFLVLNGNAQESLDTIKSFTLSEVVVKAERIIHKGDHDVLYWHSCISPWQYNHVIQRLWTL